MTGAPLHAARLQVLYHGNCFDGVLSAAIFSQFYRDVVEPGAQVAYRPMAHGATDPYGEDHERTFAAPVNAVVDFRYSASPRLTWWCDHHLTTFLSEADRAHFEADTTGHKRFDPEAPSCAGLLARWLERDHGYARELFADHVHWADIIDSAAFHSPAQAVELKEPALQLMALLESGPGDAICHRLLTELGHRSIAQVHAQGAVRSALRPVLAKQSHTLEVFRRCMKLEARVATFDLTGQGVEGFNKFIPYYLADPIDYTVGLTVSPRRAKVSVGSNPWHRPNPLVNIGELCRRFGGGGHAVVGAVTLPADRLPDARRAFDTIVRVLRGEEPAGG